MSDSDLFEALIPMPLENATVTVTADEKLIVMAFDTGSCVMLSHMFVKESANAVRALAHALLAAADAADQPSMN